MENLKKGSQWRKWDLHVHTPASVLESQYGSDWDRYVVELFKRAIANDIAAIGITDYYLPTGYRKLKKEYLEQPQKMAQLFSPDELIKINCIAIFPNIEFRLSKLIIDKQPELKWNRKVNFHVILSNEVDIDCIDSEFISQIQIIFDASIGGAAEKRPLSQFSLECLGNKLISEHEPFAQAGSPLFVGMLNASVDENEIIEILSSNSLFREKYLIGLPTDEDLSRVNWNSQGHSIRKTLIKQAHFIFSSNPATCNFFSGGSDKDRFVSEFGAIKPCLWGSDAHHFEKMFAPDKGRHTWIKADATFEGLKQVIYDPGSRSRIQETSPQQKNSYQTIDCVRFIDKNNTFSDEYIHFNPDLNTIIGGKSSGKSMLLYHIAKAINPAEVDEKVRLAKASEYKGFDIDFEVVWSNGDLSKLSDVISTKPITYIPQLYINHLAEEDGKSQLNELVKSILMQNDDFKSFTKNQEQKISDTHEKINGTISRIYRLKESYKSLAKDSSEIGTKSAIEEEIKRLQAAILALREKAGFSEQEERAFNHLNSRKGSLEKRHKTVSDAAIFLKQLSDSLTLKGDYLVDELTETVKLDIDAPKHARIVTNSLAELQAGLKLEIESYVSKIALRHQKTPSTLARLDSRLKSTEQAITPLLEKIKEQKALEVIREKLKSEEAKLKRITEIEHRLLSIATDGKALREDLYQSFGELVITYTEYVKEISRPEYQLEEAINISANVAFSSSKFDQFVKSFDGRGNLTNLVGDLADSEGNYIFCPETHAQKIFYIDEKIRRKDEKLPSAKKGTTEEDIIRKLYSDCFYINYSVSYKEDQIETMSPGKRGLVLLNLILHLSNASHPILIDQPEDNLDNRTIYDQLNDFIRDRKKKRQIIMVTHNANLVVAADAECVIVANQDGQQRCFENEKFKFEYCSGSLENSFEDSNKIGILKKQGIRQHVCQILEGGILAFKERELKYGLK
ncbi:TrlF family AAA-like ATPase [Stutzerimonas zhaodongensis]|jgi:hypothetical protein|uniref:ATPase involved in DNA repair n=2 Tax=Stutzerimonas zhaodongensis TaxID=1176257 RepID=A0ABX8ITJ2_9GAMM|nr:hypothetical protein [Stutzerimonas zhaodongensis]QWV16808.1 hypothetical protein KQ248_20505 [Stutzerimonas zhaodongensis]